MVILAYFLVIVYFTALLYITTYCLLQFHLLYFYKKYRKKNESASLEPSGLKEEFPFVTIQLPVFNEMYVVGRLIDNIAKMNYPRDRMEIHVLDDSTDETLEISRKKVEEYRDKGYQIELFHRHNRQGYKAGALRDAMPYARGEFIAIFDADFLPDPGFLKNTIPHFTDKKVGVVQTRWEHINQNYSMLTRLQAMQLNVHFTVEQQGRAAGNCLLQFNGTAGLWRRETIEDAGGWEADTLTEDLDLSYRAQLRGWKIIYLENILSPAELPAEMNGLKSQQFRWMKGGAESARKLLPTVWQSEMALYKKIHATGHLLGSSVFLFIFAAAIFSVPLLFVIREINFSSHIFGLSLLGLMSVIVVYYVANVQAETEKSSLAKRLLKFLFLFPVFLALSMGLSLHNSIAVIQGYIGRKSPFVRTPKFDIKGLRDSFKKNNYLGNKMSLTTFFEGLLSLYFLVGVLGAFYVREMVFVIFHLLLTIGFGAICYFSIRHLRLK